MYKPWGELPHEHSTVLEFCTFNVTLNTLGVIRFTKKPIMNLKYIERFISTVLIERNSTLQIQIDFHGGSAFFDTLF